MKTSLNGSLAVALLCSMLVACGGSGSDSPPAPTALPASVAITASARAEAGASLAFATDLATTNGLTFRWDFGDGTSGAGATTAHAYAKPGTYQVTLAVANDAEDLRTTTTTITVGAYANVAGLACTQADSAGWCWQHAIVTGHQVNDVFFTDATHAWAVGDNLTILKSSDAGATWTQVAVDPSIATASLRSVRFRDAQNGMALDDRGSALQTRDGGLTWFASNLGMGNGNALSFIDYRAGRIVLQASFYSGGVMSVDDGISWTYVASSGTLMPLGNDCLSLNSGELDRVPGCGTTLTSLLYSYVPNGFNNFAATLFSSDTQGIVIGSGFSYDTYSYTSQVWTTTDGGATWATGPATGLPQYYYAGNTLRQLDAQALVMYSPSDLNAYVTLDGGHTWTTAATSPALTQAAWNYWHATGVMGRVLWQSAANRLALSTDRGQTWQDVVIHAEDATLLNNGQTAAPTLVQYVDANHFVVGLSHRFYVTSDGGATFVRVLGADARDAASVGATGEFRDVRNGKFLTANGALLSTADGGRTWTRSDYPNAAGGGVALHFTSATEGWLVLGGKLAHSTDAGATWAVPLVNAAMVSLQGMSWGDATHVWTWNGTLYYSSDAGATWTAAVMPNSMGVASAVMTGPLTGVATSGYGAAAYTSDGGVTWWPVSTGGAQGPLVRAGGQTVWSLSGATPIRSKDGGHTWQFAGPVLNNGVVTGMSFADAQHGWMISSAGAVLHTIDGGDSWASQPVGTDLSLQAVVAADAMTAWIITRDGQILSTATAGN